MFLGDALYSASKDGDLELVRRLLADDRVDVNHMTILI